jgi:hypothetical protein
MECAEAVIFEDCRATIAEIAAILVINAACPWCKPPVYHPSLRRIHLSQMDYN